LDGNALDSRPRKSGTLTGISFVAGQNEQRRIAETKAGLLPVCRGKLRNSK
jgi:hypothetical protein